MVKIVIECDEVTAKVIRNFIKRLEPEDEGSYLKVKRDELTMKKKRTIKKKRWGGEINAKSEK